jgi:hypothetical protein
MRREAGVRQRAFGASSHALSARAGDQSRSILRREARAEGSARMCLRSVHPSWQTSFSPFVLALDDSESLHADPSGTSLALSDRLAGDQPDRALHPSRRALRALPSAARTSCGAARRLRWYMVGHRDRRLARRSRSPASTAADVRTIRRRPDDPKARVPGYRSSQPRSDVQRSALAQPRSALSALPHDPRRPRTPAPPVVECVPASRLGRSFHRAIQLAAVAGCRIRRERQRRAELRTWARIQFAQRRPAEWRALPACLSMFRSPA